MHGKSIIRPDGGPGWILAQAHSETWGVTFWIPPFGRLIWALRTSSGVTSKSWIQTWPPPASIAARRVPGPAAAATLADKGVTVLVGGMAGPKMQDVLDERGVRFVRRIGTVQDVVNELRNE